jgi:hypothetical protein
VVFKTTAIDHSAIPPREVLLEILCGARLAVSGILAAVFCFCNTCESIESPCRVPQILGTDDSIATIHGFRLVAGHVNVMRVTM